MVKSEPKGWRRCLLREAGGAEGGVEEAVLLLQPSSGSGRLLAGKMSLGG